MEQARRQKNHAELQKSSPRIRLPIVINIKHEERPQVPHRDGNSPKRKDPVDRRPHVSAEHKKREEKIDESGGKRNQLEKLHVADRYALRIKHEFFPAKPLFTFMATLSGYARALSGT